MANHTSRRKKRLTLALMAVVVLSGAGAAFAYWTSTGTGSGSAQTGTSSVFTITVAAPVGTITPDGAGQTVSFTVENPGPGTQALSAVSVAMAGPTGVPWVPPTGCEIADYTATVSVDPSPATLAAGDSVTGQATVTLTSTNVNQNACQGEAVPLYFTAS